MQPDHVSASALPDYLSKLAIETLIPCPEVLVT